VGAVRELVKRIVLRYIGEKPRRISLRLLWSEGKSLITIDDKTIEIKDIVDFTSFGYGVVDAYREVFGDLEVIPVDLRTDIYQNNRVKLELYPTGSLGVFDIYVEYH
jgi:hypothetical protein